MKAKQNHENTHLQANNCPTRTGHSGQCFLPYFKSGTNGTKRYSTEISAHNRPKTQVSENQKCTTRYKTVQKRYRNPKKLYRPVQNGTLTASRY